MLWCKHKYLFILIYAGSSTALDPGASRNRGSILKDLIKPYVKLAEAELEAGQIDEATMAERKKICNVFAKELIMCYKHEKFF